MSKLMPVVAMAAAVAFVSPAFAEEKSNARGTAPAEEKVPPGAEAEGLEEEKESPLSVGFDNDLFSAYIFRNAVFNDELVWQPCVWAEVNVCDWFRVGGYAWQNWDLTKSRSSYAPQVMNETDFAVYIGRSIWESDDGEYVLDFELGNNFYTYRQIEGWPNSYEFYLTLTFDNPYVSVYGQYAQAYNPVVAPYFELGLKKSATLAEMFSSENEFLGRWTLAADWNMSFASGKFFTAYLYGTLPEGAYDPELEEYEGERGMSDGIGGTTIKGSISYQVCDHFSLGLVCAYTALLSGEACDAMDYAGYGNMYKRLVWGGLQAKIDF